MFIVFGLYNIKTSELLKVHLIERDPSVKKAAAGRKLLWSLNSQVEGQPLLWKKLDLFGE